MFRKLGVFLIWLYWFKRWAKFPITFKEDKLEEWEEVRIHFERWSMELGIIKSNPIKGSVK